MLWLEVDGNIAGEVSLDPAVKFVTDFEISDCAALGIRTDWYDATRDIGEIVQTVAAPAGAVRSSCPRVGLP